MAEVRDDGARDRDCGHGDRDGGGVHSRSLEAVYHSPQSSLGWPY